jgi:hypothetical protein
MPYLIEYYLDKLTSEYRSSTRMNAWLNANLKLFQDMLTCIRKILPEFDIDTARGVQLDVLGAIVGQKRQVDFQTSAGGNPILDDETYRLLLRARIAMNHWDGKIGSAMNIWGKLFPGGRLLIYDHQDMSATIFYFGAFTPMIKDLIEHGYIIPRPEGVLYDRTTFLDGKALLGFDRNDELVAGFETADADAPHLPQGKGGYFAP